jgi:hypothetical protein
MPSAQMPQSNVQHAVPQNIMDVEFKLIGELTMRQFSYLLVFGLLAYFSTNIPGLFKWPAVLFFAILAIGLAFVPVQERGLDEWLVNFYRAITSPTQRVWKKEPQIPTAFLYDNLAVVQHELITLTPTSSRRKLEDYLKTTLEEGSEDPLDIPLKDTIKKLRETYRDVRRPSPVGVLVNEPIVEMGGATATQEPSVDLEEMAGVSEVLSPMVSTEKPIEEVREEIEKVSESVVSPDVVLEEEKDVVKFPSEQPLGTPSTGEISVLETQKEQKMQGSRKEVEERGVTEDLVIKKARSIYDRSFYADLRKKSRSGQRFSEGFSTGDRLDYGSYDVITPDTHSGRKFVNLVPSGGEIILPIRGERVLKTSEDVLLEKDIEEKARQLEELLNKIRSEEGIAVEKTKLTKAESKPSTPEQIEVKPVEENIPPVVDKNIEEVVDKLKKQNEELVSEIKKLKDQIEKNKAMSIETGVQEQLLKKLESQRGTVASTYEDLRKQIQDLQKKLDEKVKVSTGSEFIEKAKRQLPVLTDKPNVLSGVVRDSSGNVLSDILILVKNSRGDTVRALKTNSLGQFVVSTPLPNGSYTVEVSSSNKTDLTFAIIPVEVKGEIIPTLDVVGK